MQDRHLKVSMISGESTLLEPENFGLHEADPETEKESMQWKHGVPTPKKILTQLSAGKMMATVFRFWGTFAHGLHATEDNNHGGCLYCCFRI
jgi:hypothetical protein